MVVDRMPNASITQGDGGKSGAGRRQRHARGRAEDATADRRPTPLAADTGTSGRG